jgi:hypothetical protein
MSGFCGNPKYGRTLSSFATMAHPRSYLIPSLSQGFATRIVEGLETFRPQRLPIAATTTFKTANISSSHAIVLPRDVGAISAYVRHVSMLPKLVGPINSQVSVP